MGYRPSPAFVDGCRVAGNHDLRSGCAQIFLILLLLDPGEARRQVADNDVALLRQDPSAFRRPGQVAGVGAANHPRYQSL
jgi:hypothetical protein